MEVKHGGQQYLLTANFRIMRRKWGFANAAESLGGEIPFDLAFAFLGPISALPCYS